MRDLTPSVVRSRLYGLGDAHPTRDAHAASLGAANLAELIGKLVDADLDVSRGP